MKRSASPGSHVKRAKQGDSTVDSSAHTTGTPQVLDLPHAGGLKPLTEIYLSALTWDGVPTKYIVSYGTEGDHVGVYQEAAPPFLFNLNNNSDNTPNGPFQYTPAAAPAIFRYTRSEYVGHTSSELTYYGRHLGDDMSPILRIAPAGVKHWPERVKSPVGSPLDLFFPLLHLGPG